MSKIFEEGICAEALFKMCRIPEDIYGLVKILLSFESIAYSIERAGETVPSFLHSDT